MDTGNIHGIVFISMEMLNTLKDRKQKKRLFDSCTF